MFAYQQLSNRRKVLILGELFLLMFLLASNNFSQTSDSEKNTSPTNSQNKQNSEGTIAEKAARGEIPQSFADERLKIDSQKIRLMPPTSLPEQSVGAGKLQQNGVIRNLEPEFRFSADSTAFDVDGGKVYLTGIVSEGAKSVRVRFENVKLPDGARIFVYPLGNKDEFYGAYSNKSPLVDGSFWTPPVQGDGIIVELFVPSNAENSAKDFFQLKEISHNFVGQADCSEFGIPGPCHNEVGSAYASMASAVGYLEFMTTQGSFICTGTLMNTVSVNFMPFLMTANHCFSTQASAQSLRVYWNYNTGEFPPGGTPFTDGANLLSTSPQSDFTFVKLTGNVTGGLTYVGWDGGDPPANSSIVGIHHPRGSHKRISFGFSSAIGSVCTGSLPSACGNFIPVVWNSGVTEGGSSGSALFYTVANGGRFIGNLWGGGSSCSSPSSPDWYGRFGLTYGKVNSYLADGNCTYGISPSNSNFSASGGNGSFGVTTGSACYQSAVISQPTTIQTFSNATSISIADRPSNTSPPGVGSLYPSNINVSGLSGTVTRVRVTINGLTHTYPDDLDFLLVGPSGQTALLMSDTGGSDDISSRNYTIDQSGLTLLKDDLTNTTGTYRPSNYAGLNSVDTGGTDNFPSPAPGQTTYDNLLTFFHGTNPNGTWRLYVTDDEAGDVGTISGGWSLELATNNASWLSITSGGNGYGNSTVNYSVAANSGAARTGIINVGGQTHTVFQNAGTTGVNRKLFDFDGDNKADISIFRPSNGQWWYLRSSDNGNRAYQFGQSTDKLAPGDYTGDGRADIAFWRPSDGGWYILRSENDSFFSFPFGTNGDIPAPADFDGDGKTDAAVYRPSNQTWYILRSSGGTLIVQFGFAEDKPVVADYDGDGKADIAIFRPSNGQWWYLRSSDGTNRAFAFGLSSDKPVPGDYTGDGKADIAFWRPSNGNWFILRSEDSSFFSFPFGVNGDIPAPADYDGDGKFDPTVFRPSNATWYVNRSTAGLLIVGFGFSTDRPVPNAFVP